MSTDRASRRERTRRRRRRAFAASFAAVIGILAVVGLTGAAMATAQGPRVTEVQVDPAAAAAASGSRLIVTTTQSLEKVSQDQVEVTPATPFSVDTSGRSVGVRFGLTLRDDTDYRVAFTGVRGLGSGPAVSFTQTFHTPPARVFALERGTDGGDTISRTDLAGADASAVLHHPHIEDFRGTSDHLVMSVRNGDKAALLVTAPDGKGQRALPLPGDGFVSNLQSSDRGDLIGYTFSDATLSDAGGRESVLFTASLNDAQAGAAPTPVTITGADPRVSQWSFVPDSASILLLSFDGSLLLTDASGSSATVLGKALAIDGVAGSKAIVERDDGMVVLDLTDGSETPLPGAAEPGSVLRSALPIPGGGTLRTITDFEGNLPTRTEVRVADDDGAAVTVFTVGSADSLKHTCVAPSGRYAAILIAPDIVHNPYATAYLLPLPERMQTHIIDLGTAREVGTIPGFDLSWCRLPPAD